MLFFNTLILLLFSSLLLLAQSADRIAVRSVEARLQVAEKASAAPQKTVRVERVVDGDTLLLEGGEKIRLLNVDTPESVHRDQRKNSQEGKDAAGYMQTMATGKEVRLERAEKRDIYGRVLADVFIGELHLNVELVRQGLARYYTKYGISKRYNSDFQVAEDYARRNSLGFWHEHRYVLTPTSPVVDAQPSPRRTVALHHSNAMVVASRSGVFHNSDCPSVKKIKEPRTFATSMEAASAGLRPCKRCRP